MKRLTLMAAALTAAGAAALTVPTATASPAPTSATSANSAAGHGSWATQTTTPPDPAPFGPQRPYEPDVEDTDNIDSLAVTATKGAGQSVTVDFDRTSRAATEGELPAGARRFVFLFDRSISFHPEAFATCDRSVVEAQGVAGCPAGSQIGGGRAEFPNGAVHEVFAVNTRIGDLSGVLVVIPGLNTILEQTLERVVDPYDREYRWALDEIVPPNPLPPQDRVGTSRFQLSFGATTVREGRTVGFAETTAPVDTPLKFGLWTEFVTGQVILPETEARLTAQP